MDNWGNLGDTSLNYSLMPRIKHCIPETSQKVSKLFEFSIIKRKIGNRDICLVFTKVLSPIIKACLLRLIIL